MVPLNRTLGRRLRSVGCYDMIVVLAGTSGIGKTTIGNVLATRLDWTFEDSDALHSAAAGPRHRLHKAHHRMSASTEALNEQIKQSVALLRRHL